MMLAATVNGLGFLISAFFVAKAFPRSQTQRAPEDISLSVQKLTIRKKFSIFFAQLFEGFKYIAKRKGMLGFVLGAAVTNFFITAQHVTLPFFITNQKGWATSWFGHVLSALALGSFFGH
jgi:hypothetical protein